MAEQNIVDVSWDLDKFDAETKAVIKDMMSVYDLAKKNEGFKISPGSAGGYTELNKQQKQLNDNLIAQEKLKQQQIKTEQALLSQKQKQQTVADREKKSVADLSNYYKELGLSIKDAQIKYYNLARQLGRNHPLSQAALKDANDLRAIQRELAQDTGIYTHDVGNYSGALTNFALTLRGIRGPTKLFGEALGFSAQEADQFRLVIEHAAQALAVFFRSKEAKAAESAKAAAATAAETAAQNSYTVSTAAATGATDTFVVSQEANVAVTEEETVALVEASAAAKGLRIALISTGIGLLVAGIAYAIYKFIELKKSMSDTVAAQKLINKVNEEAADSYGKEASQLAILKNKIEDVKQPMDERLQAVKDIQKEYPKYFEGLTTEQILAGQVADAYDKLTQSLIRKARAQAAEGELDKIEAEKFKLQLQNLQDVAATNDLISKAKGGAGGGGSTGGGGGFVESAAQEKAAIIGLYNIRKKAAQDKIDELNKTEAILLKIAVEGFSDREKAEKEGGGDHILADLVKKDSAYAEIYKRHIQDRIAILKDSLDNDKDYYAEKIKVLDKYTKEEKRLIEAEAAGQIKAAREEEARQVANLEKDKKGKTPEQVARITENQEVLAYNLAQKELNINDEKNSKLNKSDIEHAKEVEKLDNDRLKNITAVAKYELQTNAELNKAISSSTAYGFNERIIAYGEYYKDEQKLLQDDFDLQVTTQKLKGEALLAAQADLAKKQNDLAVKRKKEISDIIVSSSHEDLIQAESLNKEKLSKDELALYKSLKKKEQFAEKDAKLQRDAERADLYNSIAHDQKLQLLTDVSAEEKVKAGERVLEAENKLRSLDLQDEQATEKKKAADKEMYRQLEKLGIQTFFDLTKTLADQAHEKRIAQLEIEAKLLDENHAKEIKNLNESTLSAQEKQAAIQMSEKQTEAKRKEIAAREHQEKIKQFNTDKALTIAKIVIETALAVMRSFADSGYVGAILAGATGAAELAMAAAQQPPAYGEGGVHEGTGKFIVGEKKMGNGYEPELVEHAGKSFITSRPMLLNNMPGAKITPMSKIVSMHDAAVAGLVGNPVADNRLNEIRDAVMENGYMVTQALKRQKAPIVNMHLHADWYNKIEKEVRR